ncbi:AAA family ATPase [Methanotorris formicicus]|uniref:ATPase associated with various cellular activities AAA_3 n=1 Tax=Methanotorris formicicus Mc-S-70 TaxID=647171 RepID=H1KXE4_9EURY|nr:MoxR family ATPase [Methanotorris formicicus]EHP88356.1 ATPase associated with various cellular activities AAA_3 [Methanotorris formicicus Mc-S-70]
MDGCEFLNKIMDEMKKCIVGNEIPIKLLTIALLSGGHVLLEGTPGIGKTTIAKNFANIFGLKFSRIQLTPDMMPSDITGFYYFNQKTGEFEFKKGPIFANIILADEINRTPPKTQSALLEAMQENAVTIEGKTFKLEEPFMIIATKNPIEFEGVYELPEAEKDRFMFKIRIDYPKEDEELDILLRKHEGRFHETSNIISPVDLKYAMISVKDIKIGDKILRYICNIVRATRNDERLEFGASPRASEYLLYASKALAYLNGRSYVIPDDVKFLAKYVLIHRIKVKGTYELDNITEKDVVEDILRKVEVPK